MYTALRKLSEMVLKDGAAYASLVRRPSVPARSRYLRRPSGGSVSPPSPPEMGG